MWPVETLNKLYNVTTLTIRIGIHLNDIHTIALCALGWVVCEPWKASVKGQTATGGQRKAWGKKYSAAFSCTLGKTHTCSFNTLTHPVNRFLGTEFFYIFFPFSVSKIFGLLYLKKQQHYNLSPYCVFVKIFGENIQCPYQNIWQKRITATVNCSVFSQDIQQSLSKDL